MCRYETQLATERDASQRLKAENVVLQRKMGDMQAHMEAQKAEAAAIALQNKRLQEVGDARHMPQTECMTPSRLKTTGLPRPCSGVSVCRRHSSMPAFSEFSGSHAAPSISCSSAGRLHCLKACRGAMHMLQGMHIRHALLASMVSGWSRLC